MRTSILYKSSFLYELVMRVLYGRSYESRYKAIADLIPEGSSVLDLCCGPAALYFRHLRDKRVRYTGVDVNASFVQQLVQRGVPGEIRDLRSDANPLPAADYVLMQASLYHFLPDLSRPGNIVDRMLEAARVEAIVAEPIRNLADSRNRLLASIARHTTNAGKGPESHRFDEQRLDEFFQDYKTHLIQSFLIPGGREKVYVLRSQ